jgi:hypothetical protein
MATTQKPARAPRKPSRASEAAKGGTTARKPATARRTAKTTGSTKPNPFDDIARQVKADQEAKDREAGRDDLAPALAKSVDQAKVKPAATKPAKPARPPKPTPPPPKSAKPAMHAKPAKPTRPAKVQVNGNGKPAFSGRPVSNPAKVAERVKQLGLRVRADADVDALAAKLRATPDGVSQWLASRNGSTGQQQPAKASAKVKPSANAKQQQAKPPTITLGHVWGDKRPDWLYRCTLVTRYEVHPDGSVWSTLHQVLGPDGKVLEDFWRLPLDYRPTQEVQGNGRKLILKDRTITGLQTWLIREGLTTADDITVTT